MKEENVFDGSPSCGRSPGDIKKDLNHCCQIPSGLLGQFSQKNSAAGEKIRPQAGHPPNHQKKCSKKLLLQNFWANFCQLLLKLGRN
jgi:hypothetical protein